MVDLVVPSTLVEVSVDIFLCRQFLTFSFHLVSSALAAAIIAGIVIACLVAFICFVLIITIPICICCCLGVGIGAAASSGGTRYTYSNI